MEFDLDGESGNSEGAVGSNNGTIRTRIASVAYKVSDAGTVNFGKQWDTFAAFNPHTYSVTTVQLKSGNTGFITEALAYSHSFGALSASLQLQTRGASDKYVISAPINTVRFDYAMGDHTVGLAHKAGTINTKDTGTAKNISTSGTKLFYKGMFGATSLIAEYFTGSNLGSSTIGAGHGVATPASSDGGKDVEENGYYLSVKHQLDGFSVFAGVGMDEITNPKKLGLATSTASAAVITKNAATRIGFDYDLDKDTKFFAEMTSFSTGYWNATDDKSKNSDGSMMDIGMMYKF